MRKRFLIILAGIMMVLGAIVPKTAFAEKCGGPVLFGLESWYSRLECTRVNGKLEVSQSNFSEGTLAGTTIPLIIAVVVKDLMFVAGFVAVGFVMYGGFLMVTSAGNPGAVEKAKKTISGALVGLVIAILAYAIVTAVLGIVTGGDMG